MGLFDKMFGESKNNRISMVSELNRASSLNTDNMYDICYALACMVGFSALTDKEERSSTLLVRMDCEKMETSIYAHGDNWVSDFRNEAEYEKLNVPVHIAKYLTKVEFQMNNNALTIAFNQVGNSNSIKQKIEEGIKLLSYQPEICQLKSYQPGKNYMITCVELFVARD